MKIEPITLSTSSLIKVRRSTVHIHCMCGLLGFRCCRHYRVNAVHGTTPARAICNLLHPRSAEYRIADHNASFKTVGGGTTIWRTEPYLDLEDVCSDLELLIERASMIGRSDARFVVGDINGKLANHNPGSCLPIYGIAGYAATEIRDRLLRLDPKATVIETESTRNMGNLGDLGDLGDLMKWLRSTGDEVVTT